MKNLLDFVSSPRLFWILMEVKSLKQFTVAELRVLI